MEDIRRRVEFDSVAIQLQLKIPFILHGQYLYTLMHRQAGYPETTNLTKNKHWSHNDSKPVFGVCDQVRHKLAFGTTETGDIQRQQTVRYLEQQMQAVQKLYEEVKKRRQRDEVLSSSTPEFVELKSLWQLTSTDQSAVARAAGQVWLQLVTEGVAEFSYVLNGLLNQVPTAKNLQGLIETVSHLLQIQLILTEETGNQYECLYNIRVSSNAVAVLDPFLRFVFLQPKQPAEYAGLRSGLMSALVTVVMETEGVRQQVFDYLVGMLQGLQISTPSSLFEVSQFSISLLQLLPTCPSLLGESTQKLVNFSLSLSSRCHVNNISFTSLTQRIFTLGWTYPQCLHDNSNLAVIGQLMLKTYFPDNASLLNIVKLILKTNPGLLPLSVGMVLLPVLNILATPKMAALATQHKLMTSLAGDVIALVESYKVQMEEKKVETSGMIDSRQLTEEGYQAQTCNQLTNQLSDDTIATTRWLTSLQGHMTRSGVVPGSLMNLLSSILVMVPDTGVSTLAVDRLVDIAKHDVAKAPLMLPLLLYSLGKTTCPTLKLHILHALPKIATHKVCVPPVLKTIQSLGLSSKLKSICIKLMTELWTLQDRCFPHLLKLITDDTEKQGIRLVDDVTLAKAVAIRQVCKLRPEQHGADMLGPLHHLLNTCGDEKGSVVSALALEALYYLCEAEVIDIMSAWAVLEAQLLKDTRPVVIVKICELFSLVPSLAIKSEEYEVFVCETVRRLWLYTQSSNSQVTVAAFKALSSYTVDHFKISHLQLKYVEDFVQQAEAALSEDDPPMSVDSLIPKIPGVCYVRLLRDLHQHTIQGYEIFLSTMVGKEVENLPRGIYYTSLRKPGVSANQGKAVSSIPSFIQTQNEKTKLPALRPELAAGLLFCYDPPIETGRDGRPRKHYAITHGKNYQQMYNTLLHEVPVPTSELHRLTLMPQAWGAFMERLFASMLQSRRAEIELQQGREYIDDSEADSKKTSAWLWVRDTLVDMIKGATRGNPSIQSNAILSLAGLLNTVHKYATSLAPGDLKTAESSTEYKSHSHWSIIVIESLMSLVDFQYKPKGDLLGLCQQRSAEDRLPASLLAQTTASLALAYISPILITTYVELVFTLLVTLTSKLPGQQSSEELSPLVHMFSGVSLGVLLSQLCLESFGDVCGSQGSLETMKALYALEDCCLSSLQNRTGCLLGLSEAIVSMCRDGKPQSRAHVSSIQEKLTGVLENTEISDPDYQALCMCTCQIAGTAFMYNITEANMADKVLQNVAKVYENNKENVGVCLSLGLLCHSLIRSGHTAVNTMAETLSAEWTAAIECQDSSTSSRLAAVNGLVTLVGSESTASQKEATVTTSEISLSSVITMATKVITSGNDISLQGHTAWLLGRLYHSSCSVSESKTAVPTSYSYLPDSSILRAIVDFLLEAGKIGPDNIDCRLVEVVLTSLQDKEDQSLPPLNWAALLSPLIRLKFGERIQTACLQLAVNQCTKSPTAALFLSSWVTPPLFTTLTVPSQAVLLKSTGTLVRVIAPAVLSIYLDKSCKAQCGLQGTSETILRALFSGLQDALALPDPPEAVINLLRITLADIFVAMEKEKNVSKLTGLSGCLSCVPDNLVDQLLSADCQGDDAIYRGTFVRCYLVCNGYQPLALLNSCIDAAFNNEQCVREQLLVLLAHCFYRLTLCDREHARVINRVQWLLEIMGHVRNVVTRQVPLSNSQVLLSKVGEFAINIIASAICLWTNQDAAAIFGLTSDLYGCKDIDSDWSLVDHLTFNPIELLPSYISGLLKEPWSQLLPKVLDWLTEIQEQTSPLYKHYLQECFLSLRGCRDFQKSSMWTRAKLPQNLITVSS